MDFPLIDQFVIVALLIAAVAADQAYPKPAYPKAAYPAANQGKNLVIFNVNLGKKSDLAKIKPIAWTDKANK